MIMRIKQGERELLEVLAKRYYQDIFRFCWYRAGSEEAAWECTQETFLRMIRFLGGYKDRNRFKAWLLAIAVNVCADYFRGRAAVFEDEGLLEEMPSEPAEGNQFHRVEERDRVMKALSCLPQYQRETVILRFYYDLKVREIAKITGVGIPTAKSRLRQGMEKLREILGSEEGR